MEVSHAICDPTLKCSILRVWNPAQKVWMITDLINPLFASTYLYNVKVSIFVLKISLYIGTSIMDCRGSASMMANLVYERDRGQCWVSGFLMALTNSHVCPKRMGHHLLCNIYYAFISPPPPTLSVYNECCGITLNPTAFSIITNFVWGWWHRWVFHIFSSIFDVINSWT